MKKLLYLLLISGSLFTAEKTSAQFRSIPGVVTDSFKIKYPHASGVNWSDRVTSFQATFSVDKEKYTAWYTSKGEWQKSEKVIKKETLPAAVTDGYSKSKYNDSTWKWGTIKALYLPGDIIQYNIFIYKSDITRKNLLFSSEGQLLKDGSTI